MADVEIAPRAERDTSERKIASGVRDVVVAAPLFITAPLYRRWHLRWGATDAEVAGEMPGDEIVPRAGFNTTRALTIDAPPRDVWPWIVQLGYGRAGFYSYDIFDNAGRPSADRIIDDFQHPRVGDWVPMASKVNETTAFKIRGARARRVDAVGEAQQHLGLEARAAPRRPHAAGHPPEAVQRLGGIAAMAALTVILFEFGDYPMMRRLLLGVKARAEAYAHTAAGAAAEQS